MTKQVIVAAVTDSDALCELPLFCPFDPWCSVSILSPSPMDVTSPHLYQYEGVWDALSFLKLHTHVQGCQQSVRRGRWVEEQQLMEKK